MEHLSNQFPEIQKSIQVKQGCKQPATSSEETLSKAILAPKILDKPQESLKEVLRLVMVKIGLRAQNWPTDADKAVLIQHIEDHFGNHSPEEIKLAFDMAINGKIGDGEEFANCYENFSCAYFSKIMTAYRKWAATEVKYLPKEKAIVVKPKDEYADWSEVYEKFLEMDIDARAIPAEIYDWLFYSGKIKLSSDEKRELLKKAVPVYREWLYDDMMAKKTPERQEKLKKFNVEVECDDYMPDTILELKKVGKKIFVHERMQKEKELLKSEVPF